MKPGVRERLCQELSEFFSQRMAVSGETEVKIVDDLILLRCKGSLSPGEIEIGSMKAGRLLIQEVSEKLCQELQPTFKNLLHEIAGLNLLDVAVGLFWQCREKIFFLTIGDPIRNERRVKLAR
jgi:uncharacterized protein YbcI